MATPPVDLVIVFRTDAKSKQKAADAEQAYTRLITALKNGGLIVTGKRGTKDGEALVFVSAPAELLANMVQKERHTDFLNGVPSCTMPTLIRDFTVEPLSPADRVRFTYSYITNSTLDGGLGITPNHGEWSKVESIMPLHDKKFNSQWIKSWTSRKIGLGFSDEELETVKQQFGESLALYFAFLSFYAKSLIVPSVLGIFFFYFGSRYSPIYSFFLSLWSIVFVEWWRLRERAISVKWGTHGYARVESRRAQFEGAGDATDESDDSAFPWWKRETRVALSIPIILGFAGAMVALISGIFVIEAFVLQLYKGPGSQYAGYIPMALFMTLVPRLVGLYQSYAQYATNWENHVNKSGHEKSLTLKTFALSTIVAYGGLYLSAFVYVPFGQQVMALVQHNFFADQYLTETGEKVEAAKQSKAMLNPGRLRGQVFASLVTNQVINTVLEVIVPFVTRAISNVKSGKGLTGNNNGGSTKNDEARRSGDMFMDEVKEQVALPPYDTFGELINVYPPMLF
ncbi:hypothetical protein FRC02_005555 [Tulasnella sp. 418]|nr:hypothetical protein FRC02_005555 [Tulasnella sp. 418]